MIKLKIKRLTEEQKQYIKDHANDPLTVEDIAGTILSIILVIAFAVFMISSFVMQEMTARVHGTCFIIIIFCGGMLVGMVENIGNK